MKHIAKICMTCPNMGQFSYYNKDGMLITENADRGWAGCKKGKKPSNCKYEDFAVEA